MKDFKLDNKKIDSGFKAPENYFDNLEDAILLKMNRNNPKPVKRLWTSSVWLYNTAAACILIVLGFVLYFNQNDTEIDTTYLESYLVSNTTSDEIYKNFTNEDIQQLTETILNKEDIYEYVSVDFGYYSYIDNE
jgi:uncharacterized membrane protein